MEYLGGVNYLPESKMEGAGNERFNINRILVSIIMEATRFEVDFLVLI